jgi:hypothetical protein
MKHKPISNLGRFAHPPKTNVNFAKPVKDQTESNSPKIIGPKGDKAHKPKHK